MAAKSPEASGSTTARFLSSHNPAQVKRNVLTSFTNILLLPVTIVPRTVGAVGGALITGGSAAVQGISMLNPHRWAGSSSSSEPTGGSYSRNFDQDGAMLFEADAEEDDSNTIATINSDSQY